MQKKRKSKKNSNFLQSISTALKGLVLIIKNDTAIKMILLSFLVFTLVSVYLKLPILQTCFISLCWILVLILEINNTAIEIDMDYSSDKEYHPLIKKVKDYAAATVLVSSSFAIIITALLFYLRLTNA